LSYNDSSTLATIVAATIVAENGDKLSQFSATKTPTENAIENVDLTIIVYYLSHFIIVQ